MTISRYIPLKFGTSQRANEVQVLAELRNKQPLYVSEAMAKSRGGMWHHTRPLMERLGQESEFRGGCFEAACVFVGSITSRPGVEGGGADPIGMGKRALFS